jgi:hypothetical protein
VQDHRETVEEATMADREADRVEMAMEAVVDIHAEVNLLRRQMDSALEAMAVVDDRPAVYCMEEIQAEAAEAMAEAADEAVEETMTQTIQMTQTGQMKDGRQRATTAESSEQEQKRALQMPAALIGQESHLQMANNYHISQ